MRVRVPAHVWEKVQSHLEKLMTEKKTIQSKLSGLCYLLRNPEVHRAQGSLPP